MRILLVEDEIRLSQALCVLLSKKKYIVDAVYDGVSGLQYSKSGIYDLIILDIMLPKLDGFQVLKEIRSLNMTVPILMLTAKDEVQDKVSGLNYGADDYMTKPFDTEELLARVKALLRRKGEIIEDKIIFGDISLNENTTELSSLTSTVKLSLKEMNIMEILINNPHQIIPKERIIEKIWGGDSDAEYNNVEVYISFLRKKLQFLGGTVEIRTSRGIGYSLEKKE